MKTKILIAFVILVLVIVIAFIFFLLASSQNNLLTSQANNSQKQLFQFAVLGVSKPYEYGTSRERDILTLSAFLVDKQIDSKGQITLTVFVPQKGSLGQFMKVVYPTDSIDYYTVFKDNKFGNKQVFEHTSNNGLFSKLMVGRQIMLDLNDPTGDVAIKLNSGSHSLLKLISGFFFPQVKVNSGIGPTYLGDK